MAGRAGIGILEELGYLGAILVALAAALSTGVFDMVPAEVVPYLMVAGVVLSLLVIVRLLAVIARGQLPRQAAQGGEGERAPPEREEVTR